MSHKNPPPSPPGLLLSEVQEIVQVQRPANVHTEYVRRTLALMGVHVANRIESIRVSGDPKDAALLANASVIQGLTGRLMRECLYDLELQTPLLEDDRDVSVQEAEDMIKAVVPRAVDRWWRVQRDSTDFLRLRDGPAAKEMFHHRGELSSAVTAYAEQLDVDRKLTDWHQFEAARTAEYVTIDRESYPALKGEIERTYDQAVLKESTIAKLNNPDSVDEFMEETRRGVFVYGFRERVNGKPSVAEQMEEDFMKSYGPNDMRYVGKALLLDKKEILAWMTWRQMPLDPNDDCRKYVHDYLQNGVTGGAMTYRRAPGCDKFLESWRATLMFDTICGPVRKAGGRLFAKGIQEMIQENPYLRDFIAYRLLELMITPPFESLWDRNVRYAENESSGKFFGNRGCQERAEDFNTDGPTAKRVVEGKEIDLNPIWAMFSGEMPRMLLESWGIARAEQDKFGDITDDGVDWALVPPDKLRQFARKHRR